MKNASIVVFLLFLYNLSLVSAIQIESYATIKDDTLSLSILLKNDKSNPVFIQTEHWGSYGDFPQQRFFPNSNNTDLLLFNLNEIVNTKIYDSHYSLHYVPYHVYRTPRFYQLSSCDSVLFQIVAYNPFLMNGLDYSAYEIISQIRYIEYCDFKSLTNKGIIAIVDTNDTSKIKVVELQSLFSIFDDVNVDEFDALEDKDKVLIEESLRLIKKQIKTISSRTKIKRCE